MRVSPPRLMLRHTLDYGAFDLTLWRVYCWVGERWKLTDADRRFLQSIRSERAA